MEYSTKYAQEFSDKYYGRSVKGISHLYADGTMPSGYTMNGDIVISPKGGQVNGLTHYLGIGKGSDVYFFKSAFTSMEKLYMTMGHEYTHAFFFSSGLMDHIKQEAAIRVWEYNQAKAWNFDVEYYSGHYKS